MRKKKAFHSFLLICSCLFCLYPAACGASTPARLIILFTHDLHSHLDAYPTLDMNGNPARAGGYARLGTLIDRERSGNESRTLLVDAGDFSMGTLFHTVRERCGGELVAMGLLGYDATTYGNHDFEKGPEMLAATLDSARGDKNGKLPLILASNTWVDPLNPILGHLRDAQYAYPVLPYAVLRRGGLKIGLFGLMGQDAAEDVPEAAPASFTDPVEAARSTVKKLREREKADIVIALSHCGTWTDKSRSEDELLAKAVPGIDIIVSGHTHTVLDPYLRVNGTIIVSAGAYCRYLGRLEVERGPDGRLTVDDYRLIPVGPPAPEKPEVARLVTGLATEAEKIALLPRGYRFNQVIAETSASLPMAADQADPAALPASSGLGNLVTDAYRASVAGAALAFQADGLIRAPLVKGPVTVNEAFRILSLGQGGDGQAGYPLVAFWLNGEDVLEVFETTPSIGPFKSDARMAFSGMRATVDMNAPPFSRVKDVEVEQADGSFTPLDGKALYHVVTNGHIVLMMDFLRKASGGRLSVIPRDESGRALPDPGKAPLLDGDGSELKEWEALARFLQAFPDLDGNGIPDVPPAYADPALRFIPAR